MKKFNFMSMALVSSSSLPVWYKHNPGIINGYRPPNLSIISCFKSMFQIHNESGNIWTHFIGFICYTILTIHTFSCITYKKFDTKDKLAFIGFFAGILTCFMLSTLYHLFQCHSPNVFRLFAK